MRTGESSERHPGDCIWQVYGRESCSCERNGQGIDSRLDPPTLVRDEVASSSGGLPPPSRANRAHIAGLDIPSQRAAGRRAQDSRAIAPLPKRKGPSNSIVHAPESGRGTSRSEAKQGQTKSPPRSPSPIHSDVQYIDGELRQGSRPSEIDTLASFPVPPFPSSPGNLKRLDKPNLMAKETRKEKQGSHESPHTWPQTPPPHPATFPAEDLQKPGS